MKKKTIARATAIVMTAAAVSVFGLSAAGSFPQKADAAVRRATVVAEATEQVISRENAEPKESVEAKKKKEAKEEITDSGGSRETKTQKENKKTVAVNQNMASDKSSEPEPTHTHDWQEIYETAEQEIYGDRCKGCSYGTNEAGKMYEHIDADPFDGCGSYAIGVVIRTEKTDIFAGYKCICGAMK